MEITVNIPDDVAVKMLQNATDPKRALLELAIHTALVSSRISSGDAAELLGLETRIQVDMELADLRREIHTAEEEFLRVEFEALERSRQHATAA